MTETVRREDGFSVVQIECDGCGETIQQSRQGKGSWFHVEVRPLARDKWNRGDELHELDFCSTECFQTKASDLDPSEALQHET